MVSETKLIIPDEGNSRVVMIDSIIGDDRQEVNTGAYTYIKDMDFNGAGGLNFYLMKIHAHCIRVQFCPAPSQPVSAV